MTPKQKMQARREEQIRLEQERMRQAAHGAKQNYAQAKYAKLNNAFDSMKRGDQIYTDVNQMPNQENFYVPSGNPAYQAQTLADV